LTEWVTHKLSQRRHDSGMTQRRVRLLILAGGLFFAGVLIDLRPWTWRWNTMGTALSDHFALLALCMPAAGLTAGVVLVTLNGRSKQPAPVASGGKWPWLLSYRGVAAVVVVVALVGVAAVVIMLHVATESPPADRPGLEIDAIKYGLGTFAAAGAAAALLLGVRRQQHLEYAQEHTELDATERRVTDLYTKAVEQLGSADAAVRLGGLYALERVAQNNLSQRQTIINVLCAYLRMPYLPPANTKPGNTETTKVETLAELPLPDRTPASPGGRDAAQELQVRLTAQHIITSHLTLPEEVEMQEADKLAPSTELKFWPGIELNLPRATLIDWDLEQGRVRNAFFDGATFSGFTAFGGATFSDGAWFDGATFSDGAGFGGATFSGDAGFRRATFPGDAGFREATFSGDVGFGGATFSGEALFGKATFSGNAGFGGATFSGEALFGEARFSGDVGFGEATFVNHAVFNQATFSGDAWFGEATFSRDAVFNEASFSGDVEFNRATFSGNALFSHATFSGDTWFGEATFWVAWFDGSTFAGKAWFGEATFSRTAVFSSATFSRDAVFRGATFSGDVEFGEATFSGNARFDGATFLQETRQLGTALSHSRVILRDDRADTWPPDWQLQPGTDGVGTLVRSGAEAT
jgi:uncharacterized protein YjbI with pentapeptide repeats